MNGEEGKMEQSEVREALLAILMDYSPVSSGGPDCIHVIAHRITELFSNTHAQMVAENKKLREALEQARKDLSAIEIETDLWITEGNRVDDEKLNKWARAGVKSVVAALQTSGEK